MKPLTQTIPQAVKNCLWSYEVDKLDLKENRNLIVFNVLNFGNEEAVNWLFENYDESEIISIAKITPKTAWSPKSLNYWSLILGFTPMKSRFAI